MMDFTAHVFKRLRKFNELPSETAKRYIMVAPFAGDPIAKFEESMANCDKATMDAFYYNNMAEIMNLAPA